jgi:hypothetical protein
LAVAVQVVLFLLLLQMAAMEEIPYLAPSHQTAAAAAARLI